MLWPELTVLPADAIDAAHVQAVSDIEAGAGIPKPKTFP